MKLKRIVRWLLRPVGIVCALLIIVALAVADTSATAGTADSVESNTSSAPTTNVVAGAIAPVPVPEPTEHAVRFYRSGIGWWLGSEAWSWFVPALILFTGFSGWLGRQAKRIGRWEVPATFVFVFLYFLIDYLLSFPLSYFRDFVRPHEFGLSNQSFARWLDHSLMGTLVNVVIFGTTFMALRELIRRSPRRWWIYCSLLVGTVVFFVRFIQPVWIDPLTNRYGPLKDKMLEADIVALANRAGIEGARIYEVDMSADTKALNGQVVGLGATKRIVLWDTIIANCDRDELKFVMAHEMGHYVLGHVLMGSLLVSLTYAGALGLAAALGHRVITKLKERLGFESLADLGAIPLLLLFVGVFSFLTAPLLNGFSRHIEHEADRFALELTQNNRGAASYFVKSQEHNLMVSRPVALVHFWRGTHPSLAERIKFANTYHPWTEEKAGKYEHLFKGN